MTTHLQSHAQEITKILLLLLLLLGWPQSTPHGSLSPANPVIHRCQQALSGDPSARLQQMDKCASLSSDVPFAMLRFPQNQIANHFIFTPPAMITEPKVPLPNYGQVSRQSCIKHLIYNLLLPGHILYHSQHCCICPIQQKW